MKVVVPIPQASEKVLASQHVALKWKLSTYFNGDDGQKICHINHFIRKPNLCHEVQSSMTPTVNTMITAMISLNLLEGRKIVIGSEQAWPGIGFRKAKTFIKVPKRVTILFLKSIRKIITLRSSDNLTSWIIKPDDWPETSFILRLMALTRNLSCYQNH